MNFTHFMRRLVLKYWNQVINIVYRDNELEHCHMDVPGHDGKKGFVRHAFPRIVWLNRF